MNLDELEAKLKADLAAITRVRRLLEEQPKTAPTLVDRQKFDTVLRGLLSTPASALADTRGNRAAIDKAEGRG